MPFLTAGLPAPTTSNNTLPFTLAETVPLDTNLTSGKLYSQEAPTLQQLSALGYGAVNALTDGATISTDCTLGSYFSVTLGGNRTFAAFSNPTSGQEMIIEVTSDATGSRTATWNSNVTWAGGSAPTQSTTGSTTDVYRFIYNATAAKWRGTRIIQAAS